jgi:NADPH2:quinone reductase
MTDTNTLAFIDQPNGPFTLRTIPVATPGTGEVLVRIAAAGLNPLDTKIRAAAAPHARHPLPAVLGLDMAGTIEGVGPGVSGLDVGDRVFGMVGGVGGLQGTLAQYVVADAALLARVPEALGWREAAVLPLICITAYEGLIDRAQVQRMERVLVHGGAGGVGQISIQLAHARGAEVWATGRARHRATIEVLGAHMIDSGAETVDDYVARCTDGDGFDVVVDTIGGTTLDASFVAVRRYTGRVVSALGWGTHALAPLSFRGATYSGVFTLHPLLSGRDRSAHGRILREIAAFVTEGHLRPLVDAARFRLDEVGRAYDHLAGGAAIGKVAVDIDT